MGPDALACGDAMSLTTAGLGDMGEGDVKSHLDEYTRASWSGHGHHTRDQAQPGPACRRPTRCPV